MKGEKKGNVKKMDEKKGEDKGGKIMFKKKGE